MIAFPFFVEFWKTPSDQRDAVNRKGGRSADRRTLSFRDDSQTVLKDSFRPILAS
jgi:hypothetical protein